MESTAPATTTKTEEPTVKFLILDIFRHLLNSHASISVGVRPGPRTDTGNIVKDMKQYFIIKKPKQIDEALEIEDVRQLEREYQVIRDTKEHNNLIRMEEYHPPKNNIVYLALDFAIAKSLFHYITTMGVRENTENTISRNNEPWSRYLFRQFIAGL